MRMKLTGWSGVPVLSRVHSLEVPIQGLLVLKWGMSRAGISLLKELLASEFDLLRRWSERGVAYRFVPGGPHY